MQPECLSRALALVSYRQPALLWLWFQTGAGTWMISSTTIYPRCTTSCLLSVGLVQQSFRSSLIVKLNERCCSDTSFSLPTWRSNWFQCMPVQVAQSHKLIICLHCHMLKTKRTFEPTPPRRACLFRIYPSKHPGDLGATEWCMQSTMSRSAMFTRVMFPSMSIYEDTANSKGKKSWITVHYLSSVLKCHLDWSFCPPFWTHRCNTKGIVPNC